MWTSARLRVGMWMPVPAVLASLLALLAAPAWASAATGGTTAVWTSKELRFVYVGFTTKYSCDGLRDKVQDVLLRLGAQKDLKVYATGCDVASGRPSPFPGVMIRMSVLMPVAGTAASSEVNEPSRTNEPSRKNAPTLVPAHWRTVDLKLGGPGVSDAGECELVEQIKQQILPLFATRNVDYRADCVPHQVSPVGPHLRAEVLVADQATDQKGASPAG